MAVERENLATRGQEISNPRLVNMNQLLSSITAVLLCTLTTGFYLPGVAPREFKEGDNVPLKVDKISSVRSQLPYR